MAYLTKDELIRRVNTLANIIQRTSLLHSGENQKQSFIDNIYFCCDKSLKHYPDIKFVLCL